MDIKPIGVYSFVKRAELCEYYKKAGMNPEEGRGFRNVSLYLLWGRVGRKLYCRIKCPINPLPIIGWWETPDIQQVVELVKSNGWALKAEECLPLCLFN